MNVYDKIQVQWKLEMYTVKTSSVMSAATLPTGMFHWQSSLMAPVIHSRGTYVLVHIMPTMYVGSQPMYVSSARMAGSALSSTEWESVTYIGINIG